MNLHEWKEFVVNEVTGGRGNLSESDEATELVGPLYEDNKSRILQHNVDAVRLELSAMMRDQASNLYSAFDLKLLEQAVSKSFDIIRKARNQSADRRRRNRGK